MYLIDLHEDMGISKKFIVADLHAFYEDVSLFPDPNLRTSSFEVGETNECKVVEVKVIPTSLDNIGFSMQKGASLSGNRRTTNTHILAMTFCRFQHSNIV